MNAGKIELQIIADPSGAIKAVQKVGEATDGLSKEITVATKAGGSLADTFTGIATRAAGLVSMFYGFKGTLGGFVSAYAESERAVRSLEYALKQQGLYTQSTLNELRRYATELQDLTGISDDLTIQVMALLTTQGLHGDELKKATELAQDLSVAMGTDVIAAARVMADAFVGNGTMLKKYVKNLDEAEVKQRGAIAVIEQVTKAIGGHARAVGETGSAALSKFSQTFGDFREVLGRVLLNGLKPVIQGLESFLKVVMEAPPHVHALTLGVTALAGAFMLLGGSMKGPPLLISLLISGIITTLGLLGIYLEKTETQTTAATKTVREQIRDLMFELKQFKAEVGSTPEIERLQKRLEELQVASKEVYLRKEIADAETAAKSYREEINRQEAAVKNLFTLSEAEKAAIAKKYENAEEHVRAYYIHLETQHKLADKRDSEANLRKAQEHKKTIAELTQKESEALTLKKQKELELQIFRTEQSKEQAIREQEAAIQREQQYEQHLGRMRKIDEDRELATAQSEAEVTSIKRRHLEQRIQDLEQLGVLTIEQTEELEQARVDLIRLNAEEEKRIRKEVADVSYRLQELRVATIRDSYEREIESVRLRYQMEIDAAKGNHELILALERARAAEIEQIRARQRRELLEQRDDYQIIMGSISTGMQTMWSSILDASRTGREKWQDVWNSMKQSAINTIGRILQRQIEALIEGLLFTKATKAAEVTVHATAEGEKTTITQTNVIARIGAIGMEIIQSLVAAAAQIVVAVANAIRWIFTIIPFPFSLVVAAGAAGSIYALWGGAKKMFGFEKGGIFEKGQRGFIEGKEVEIIAPRRTFEEILYKEIIPKVVMITQTVTPQFTGYSERGFERVVRELQELKDVVQQKEWRPVFQGTMEGQTFIRREYAKMQTFQRGIYK